MDSGLYSKSMDIPPDQRETRPPFFSLARGLGKGCPLSPLFYVIMMDALSRKLESKRIAGQIPGVRIVIRLNKSTMLSLQMTPSSSGEPPQLWIKNSKWY